MFLIINIMFSAYICKVLIILNFTKVIRENIFFIFVFIITDISY